MSRWRLRSYKFAQVYSPIWWYKIFILALANSAFLGVVQQCGYSTNKVLHLPSSMAGILPLDFYFYKVHSTIFLPRVKILGYHFSLLRVSYLPKGIQSFREGPKYYWTSGISSIIFVNPSWIIYHLQGPSFHIYMILWYSWLMFWLPWQK